MKQYYISSIQLLDYISSRQKRIKKQHALNKERLGKTTDPTRIVNINRNDIRLMGNFAELKNLSAFITSEMEERSEAD